MTDGPEATPLDDADPVCRLSAAELATAYAGGRLSPVEVAIACLERAEAVQARCNAFTRIDHAGALAAAGASEERWRRAAPLSTIDGVPTTLKDMVWVRDWVVRYGSPATPQRLCGEDAPAVAGLRAAGAVFLGQTTTPEFGWKAVTDGPLTGITRNPWNLAMTPGGSSGGAAVAAATGAGVLHLGTDGGGSIRVPASFTGITGLKPTYGRVPAYPASPFGTVAHLGPMARHAGDVALMLGAMAGRHRDDWLQGPGRLPGLDDVFATFAGAKIGFWSAPPCGSLDPEVAMVVAGVVRDLEGLGAEVEPVDLPGDGLIETFTAHWFAGAANRVASLPGAARQELDPGLRQIAEAGARLGVVDYLRAMDERAAFGRRMDALLERFDILVSPATAVTAFTAGAEVPPRSGLKRWIEWAGFSFPLNLSQQPAISVPCGRIGGLPVGLQIAAARGADARVLGFAAAFERAFPEHVL